MDQAFETTESSQEHAATVPGSVEGEAGPGRVGPRLSEAGGVEITGVDLSKPLSPALKEQILDAFLAHHIVVFPDQSLTKDEQYDYTLNWGEIEGHVGRLADGSRYPIVHTVTNIDASGKPSTKPHTNGNYHWHTDKSYHAVPSLLTMLHALELPPTGGDTQFANTIMAYAALPEATKQRIAGLRAVHSWEASRRNCGGVPAGAAEIAERPPVVHPIVRTHPDTGEKSLYVGLHTSHIEGMDPVEGRVLLDELVAHATQPRFVYTHHWRKGELVMWDNRALLHRALANYEMDQHRRVLHRTVVRGSIPY